MTQPTIEPNMTLEQAALAEKPGLKIEVEFASLLQVESTEVVLSRVPSIGEMVVIDGDSFDVQTVFHIADPKTNEAVALIRVR